MSDSQKHQISNSHSKNVKLSFAKKVECSFEKRQILTRTKHRTLICKEIVAHSSRDRSKRKNAECSNITI